MDKISLDSKLIFLIEQYIDTFIEIPPVFCDSLSEDRKKQLLYQALLENRPLATV